jgi:hypothetical protein
MDRRLTELRAKEPMDITTSQRIEQLRGMTLRQLHEKHLELFGDNTRSHHKQQLYRRLAWRIQALAEGGLSERARHRAAELANEADLRVRAPKTVFADKEGRQELKVGCDVQNRDPRLPVVGTLLVRRYGGRDVIVRVLESGFEYEGRVYGSLSAIARRVTGTRWNGYIFFNL